jgi:thioester reductase-like protein
VGTGLLLSQLAPECEAYWATDFSGGVIDTLTGRLERDPELAGRVVLRAQPAHDTSGLPVGLFDTVILNSIVQYFPTTDYLVDVLTRMLGLVAPGGAVFLGDVRNLRLLCPLATAVHLHRADDSTDLSVLRRAVEQAVLREKELLIDPEFFPALREHLTGIAGIDIQIKRGHHHNELTRYRYDVVLRTQPITPLLLGEAPSLDWVRQVGGLPALEDYLTAQRPERLRVTGMPNHRVTHETALAHALQTGSPLTDLLDQLHTPHPTPDALDPEAFYELGHRCGYWVGVTWSPTTPDALDIVFADTTQITSAVPVDLYTPTGTTGTPLSPWTNNPTTTRATSTLINQLREYVRARLPEYMVPTAFVTLDTLPVTPNGKLDCHALPVPELGLVGTGRAPRTGEFVAPQGVEEVAMARVWAEVLGLERVGREDNFFHLGGDSLLGARLVFRLREVFESEIPLRELFRCQTVGELAATLAFPQQATAARVESRQLLVPSVRGQREQGLAAWPHPLPPLTRRYGDNVLLTGVTGFFGAFLLREVLTRHPGMVHCLVRADSPGQGWDKLRANLERYELAQDVAAWDRVRVVVGDLTCPRLGLGDKVYERLAEEIDLIIHNGAHVDALHSYETLEAANVDGTRALLVLAATTWCKPLRFVSTSGVAGYHPAVSGNGSGYVESKWRAEQVVAEARTHGLPAIIYRVPRLMGDSETGRGNDRDILVRVIRCILELGTAPDIELSEDWIPVDEAARLLVGHDPGPGHEGSFVLTAQRQVSLTEIVEQAHRIGHKIECKPSLEWHHDITRRSVEEYEVLAAVLSPDPASDPPDKNSSMSRDKQPPDGFVPILAHGVTEQILRQYLRTMSTPSPVDTTS